MKKVFELIIVRAAGRLLLWVVCLLCCVCACSLRGQLRNSPLQPFGPKSERAETLTSTSSYKLEWRRHYQLQVSVVPVGTSDERGTLWLITHAFLTKPEESLTKIDPSGQVIGNYAPKIPLNVGEWISDLSLAVSGHSVGLLASLTSGGGHQMSFEGAFFVPARADGLSTARRVADAGPQFATLVGAGPDQFIAAGDQEPLTLLKLDANGGLLWRRSFSRNRFLPSVAVGANGNIFVVSQGGRYLLVQMLDQSGRLLRSRWISARQGTVVAGDDGGCNMLFSKGIGGKDNVVYLATLDRRLRKLSEVETPFCGWSGQTYELIASPRGHLIVGENRQRQPLVAEFDRSGRLIWRQIIGGEFIPLVVPFKSGFYLVRDSSKGDGMDVERYVY